MKSWPRHGSSAHLALQKVTEPGVRNLELGPGCPGTGSADVEADRSQMRPAWFGKAPHPLSVVSTAPDKEIMAILSLQGLKQSLPHSNSAGKR